MSTLRGFASSTIATVFCGAVLLACSGGSGRARDGGRPKDGGSLDLGPDGSEDGGPLDAGPDAGVDAADGGVDGGVECNHDCECAVLPTPVGGGGLCDLRLHRCFVGGVPPTNICSRMPGPGPLPDGYCACRGGTCDERRCCVLPDGRIPYLTDPECQWDPDAGGSDGG